MSEETDTGCRTEEVTGAKWRGMSRKTAQSRPNNQSRVSGQKGSEEGGLLGKRLS